MNMSWLIRRSLKQGLRDEPKSDTHYCIALRERTGLRVIVIKTDEDAEVWRRKLAGLSLLERAVRAFQRENMAVIVADAAGYHLMQPSGQGLPRKDKITLHSLAASADYVLERPSVIGNLEASAISHRRPGDPSPDISTISSNADFSQLESTLIYQTRKTIAQDGILSVFLMRPISRQITRLLVNTSVTPNQVTIAAMLLGLLAGATASRGGYWPNVTAALLLFGSGVADCVDGELARLRLESSRVGEWLDSLADDFSTGFYLLGLAVGITALPFGVSPIAFGLLSLVMFFASHIYIYYVLVRYVGVLDTAKFPYFFAGAGGQQSVTSSKFGQIVGYVAYAFRRDFLIGLFIALAMFDFAWLSLVFLGLGLSVISVLVVMTAIARNLDYR
jgi:phosphatidylglycerophosphate synthase